MSVACGCFGTVLLQEEHLLPLKCSCVALSWCYKGLGTPPERGPWVRGGSVLGAPLQPHGWEGPDAMPGAQPRLFSAAGGG